MRGGGENSHQKEGHIRKEGVGQEKGEEAQVPVKEQGQEKNGVVESLLR